MKNMNRMAAALADVAGLVDGVVTVEPEIVGVVSADPAAPIVPNPNTPTMGDDAFYKYMVPGVVFVDRAGTYWLLEHITENGLFRIRNVWYPRMEMTIPQSTVRATIYAITDPTWIVIPPLESPAQK